MKSFEYLKPDTIEEALNILNLHKNEVKILNGGTDLLVRMRERLITPKYLIDIKDIPEFKNVLDTEDGLFIGAAVTLNELVDSDKVRNQYPILAQSAHEVGSYQLRNRATLVGNVCNASPAADAIPALVTLDASVKIVGAKGSRTVPVLDFIQGVRKTDLNSDELVKGVLLPKSEKSLGHYYKHARRQDVDLATIGVAVLYINNQWKICYGAVAPKPIRGYKTEDALNKSPVINEELLEQIGDIAVTEIYPITDIRASLEYRADMIKVGLKRAVLKVQSER